MLRGIYSAASAMSLSMQKMNLFAQNLSNSQTTGYKKKTYSVHSFEDLMVNLPDVTETQRRQQKMPVAVGSYIDNAGVKQAQGRLQQTGSALDVAIMGEKVYFQLETKPGSPNASGDNAQPVATAGGKTYTITRNGGFMIDKDNYLVNHQGDYVLDVNNNRIRLTANANQANLPPNPQAPVPSLDSSRIRIDQFGNIFDTSAGAGAPARAKLKLVEWTENKNAPGITQNPDAPPAAPPVAASEAQEILKKYGLALPDDHAILQSLDPQATYAQSLETQGPRQGLKKLLAPGQAEPLQADIKQGYLESSNVDITTEMINMMMTSKDYDMSQKLISAEDKILDKTINEMGRLQ